MARSTTSGSTSVATLSVPPMCVPRLMGHRSLGACDVSPRSETLAGELHPVLTGRHSSRRHRRAPMSKAMLSDPITPSPRVEFIKSVQRRRRWSTAEKVRLVEEAMQPGSSVSFVARRYAISPSLLFTWKRRMLEGGREAVAADRRTCSGYAPSTLSRSSVRFRELYNTTCAHRTARVSHTQGRAPKPAPAAAAA